MSESGGEYSANQPIRVLYVDDNIFDREFVRDALESSEHEFDLIEASTCDEFERHLTEFSFDIVLSDFNILGFEGLEILEIVQERSVDLPVVIVTGTGSEEVAVEAMKRGAADYVIKTVEHIRHLPYTLTAVMERARFARERQQAHEELRRAKEQSERIIAQNVDGMLVVDCSGSVRYANAAVARLLGRSHENLAGSPLGIPITAGAPVELDIPLSGKECRCVELRATAVDWDDREALLASLRDVTENKRAIEKIEHLNRMLRAIRTVNQLITQERQLEPLLKKSCRALVEARGFGSVWIALIGGSDELLFFTSAGLGRGQEEITAKWADEHPPCVDLTTNLQVQEVAVDHEPEALCRNCVAVDTYDRGEVLICCFKSDERYRGIISASLPKYMLADEDERSLFSEIARDIAFAIRDLELTSAHEQVQQLLADAETRLTLALRSSNVGLWDWRPATGEVYFSPEWCAQIGYEQGELPGCFETWDTRLHPDDRDRSLQKLNEYLDGHSSEYQSEFRLQHKDGSYRWIFARGEALRSDDGSICRMLGCHLDITERRAMEAQLAQADRLSSMGMLAAGVAHEINNPLSYILYNLEVLQTDIPSILAELEALQKSSDSELRAVTMAESCREPASRAGQEPEEDILSCLEYALKGTHRIRDIVRGLSTFSRVEPDEVGPVNLAKVVDAAVDMARNEIKYRATLEVEHGSLHPVLGSEGRLSQVFLNLLINASHAIDDGERESNCIKVTTWSDGMSVCAKVEDTGSGIHSDYLEKLFDPFFTTKKLGVGSGLGLSISKSIVEGYGGTISVESELGVGTCFTVRFPAHQEEREQQMSTPRPVSSPVQKGRILIVDDEEGIRAAMARMLKRYETVLASSGVDAQALLATDRSFDLILCDVMMSDVSGIALHRWLVEEDEELSRRFIFVTGGAFTPEAREYLAKIDCVRLEKPFDVPKFKEIVNDFIANVRSADAVTRE